MSSVLHEAMGRIRTVPEAEFLKEVASRKVVILQGVSGPTSGAEGERNERREVHVALNEWLSDQRLMTEETGMLVERLRVVVGARRNRDSEGKHRIKLYIRPTNAARVKCDRRAYCHTGR